MINLAAADRAKLTPDEQALAQQYIKEEPRSLKGVVRALSQQNREAPQSLVAETSGQKGPSSMEAGEKVAQKSPRP